MTKHLGRKIFSLLFLFMAAIAVAESEELYFDGSSSGKYTVLTSGLDASATIKCHYAGRYPLRFSGYRYRDLSYDFRSKTITAAIGARDSISIKLYRSSGRVQCFGPARSGMNQGNEEEDTSSEDPVSFNPEPSDPEPSDPEPSDPEPSDPEPSDDSGSSGDPSPANPAPSVPVPSDPVPEEPAAEAPAPTGGSGSSETPAPVDPAPVEPPALPAPEPEPELEPEPVEDSSPPNDPVPVDPAPVDDEDTSQDHDGGGGGLGSHEVNDGSSGNYPIGDSGSSTFDVRYTGEQPGSSDGTGSFRTRCEYSHAAKDDPIVFPGEAGRSHLHIFFGNTGADANSTASSLKNSGNSTCRGGIANRSSYWTPAVLRLDGSVVVPEFVDVYYKSGYSLSPNTIQPFPRGLRIVAGDSNATTTQSNAYWGCRGNYIGKKHGIPFGQCGSGDEYNATVVFPQCWDGVNLDSADHKSHMAYPSGNSCPSSHPVPIPVITFNFIYPVSGFDGVKIASDHNPNVPPGGSLHADWFEAWDGDIADTFTRSCVAAAVDCHSHLVGDGRAID